MHRAAPTTGSPREPGIATILVVDDLSANRRFLVTLLTRHGHRLVEAADGRQGLAAVEVERPDLVITDVLMPVMDGYEFVRQLRLQPATSGIPAILCTAQYGEREARELALSLGVADILTKPARVDDLMAMVDRALAGGSAVQPLPVAKATPLAAAFDREHLRLLSHRLVEKAADLRTANTRLRALINIGLELASEPDADRLLHNVCEAARELFAATYVTLGIVDLQDRTVQQVVTCGTDDRGWVKTGDAVSGILGTVITERRALRGGDPRADTAALQFPALHPDVQAFLAAPVASPANVYGWFCLVGNEGRPFSDEDQDLVTALAGQIGRIYESSHYRDVALKRTAELEHEIAERQAREEQSRQTQKMEAIGQLASGVAHDFNNLLTAILINCELLLVGLDPGDVRHAGITDIQKAGESGAGLTRQLLAFSRKEIIEPRRLDLNVVVVDMRTMLARLIGENVAFQLDLRAGRPFTMADRGQVEQILLNLAVNARDAMSTGGKLTIATANVEIDEDDAAAHHEVKSGPHVALTVSDSGSGMTPQVQARLFEPFFTTKEPGKGTGLGLATVHGIVARIGGSIRVDSEVGKGTSFTVYFPRADDAGQIAAVPTPVAPPHVGPGTVLVVEDEAVLRRLIRRVLDRLGYEVLVATNAEEARQLSEQHATIDILLTDVVMPGASGPEVSKWLVERRPGLKVIYMSGYTEDTIVTRGVLDPGVDFLHKPFTSESLGKKIREVLGR